MIGSSACRFFKSVLVFRRQCFRGSKESIPALSSLTVLYDPLELSKERIVHQIQHLCEVSGAVSDCARTWEIPVVYGGEGGPDLEEVALRAGITEEETVALHAGRDYFVYMLGFLPGFAYLGDLPKKLETPRRATPRARVPAGSVAIAAGLTAMRALAAGMSSDIRPSSLGI